MRFLLIHGRKDACVERDRRNRPSRSRAGFSLLELLTVIAIIVFLAGTAVPAIRSLTRTNKVSSASGQMVDELRLARRLAIGGRRTVYVLFLPAGIGKVANQILTHSYPIPQLRLRDLNMLTNLIQGQLRAYAMFSWRSVGDQPGQHHPRYLTEWRYLPDGILFASEKFSDLSLQDWLKLANSDQNRNPQFRHRRPLPHSWFPFPSPEGPLVRLPYIAFDPFGRIYYDTPYLPKYPGETIGLARGSVFYPKDKQGRPLLQAPPDVVETPKGNRIWVEVNWATGQAVALPPEQP